MPSTVALHSVPDDLTTPQAVASAKALRLLYALLGEQESLSSCMDTLLLAAESDGWMPLASDQEATVAQEAARQANEELVSAQVTCRFSVDKSPEWLTARSAAARGKTPEQVFADHASEPDAEPRERLVVLRSDPQEFSTQAYEVAMVLLSQASGQPLVAAVAAGQLSRTSGHTALYHEVVQTLCKVFPWLPGALHEQPNGVAPDAP